MTPAWPSAIVSNANGVSFESDEGFRVVSEQPVGRFLWFILFDAIHHRGQLSAYLRPMGGTVPAIYGSSADSPAT